MAQQPASKCPDCNGEGRHYGLAEAVCPTCGGTGSQPVPYTPEQRKADIIREYEQRTFDPFNKSR